MPLRVIDHDPGRNVNRHIVHALALSVLSAGFRFQYLSGPIQAGEIPGSWGIGGDWLWGLGARDSGLYRVARSLVMLVSMAGEICLDAPELKEYRRRRESRLGWAVDWVPPVSTTE